MNLPDDYKGAVSSGTLRNSDLLDKFNRLADDIIIEFGVYQQENWYKELFNLKQHIWKVLDHLSAEELNYKYTFQYTIEEYIELFNQLAPQGCYFGTQPGDAACFGFFQFQEEE